MKIGKRDIGKIAGALIEKRHYKALLRSFSVYKKPLKYLKDYVMGTGEYPSTIILKNNGFTLSPRLYSYHDLLTINEIFCREDYYSSRKANIIVDIGANLGISALYFLSKNSSSFVYLFEPNPLNIERLKSNLNDFNSRYKLTEAAVSDENGILEFGIENTGRYGGLNLNTGESIKVKCFHINEVLESILKEHPKIDILKFDTEGVEIKTINGIADHFLNKVQTIFFEETDKVNIQKINPEILKRFQLSNRGPIYKLEKNSK